MKLLNRICLLFLMSILFGCATSDSNAQKSQQLQAAADNATLGVAYLNQNEQSLAKEKILQALQEAPHASLTLDSAGYYFNHTGNQKAAEKYYREAVTWHPHSGRALNNYGQYLCQQKHFTMANRYFLKAAQEPAYLNTALAYENAGLCALMQGVPALAGQWLYQAIRVEPNRAKSWYWLAIIDCAKGHKAIAQQEFQRYLMSIHKTASARAPKNIKVCQQWLKQWNNSDHESRSTN